RIRLRVLSVEPSSTRITSYSRPDKAAFTASSSGFILSSSFITGMTSDNSIMAAKVEYSLEYRNSDFGFRISDFGFRKKVFKLLLIYLFFLLALHKNGPEYIRAILVCILRLVNSYQQLPTPHLPACFTLGVFHHFLVGRDHKFHA